MMVLWRMMLASAEACVTPILVKMVATVLHLVTVQCVHVHRSTLEQTVKVSDTYTSTSMYKFNEERVGLYIAINSLHNYT